MGKGNKIFNALSILLFLGSIIFLTIQMGTNGRIRSELIDEKLTSETLLSEKLALEKEIAKLKSELKTIDHERVELNDSVQTMKGKWWNAESKLRSAQEQNVSVGKLKMQNEELRKLKEDLEQQLGKLKSEQSLDQNSKNEMNGTISRLQDENKKLKEELSAARLASFNNPLMESRKANEKLTVKAKRTRKIVVALDVPVQADDLKFKITNPNGKELTSKDIVIKKVDEQNPKNSNGSVVGEDKRVRVEMIYNITKMKLNPGIYKVEVLNDLMSIGSLQVKLH